MDLRNCAVALYGRFSPGARDRLERRIVGDGGLVARDLTRRSDALVVGSLATALIDSGALGARLRTARERAVPIHGERAFIAALAGEPPERAQLPLATALSQTALTPDDADFLAAFDLIAVADDCCRFGDVSAIRTAAELLGHGRSRGDAVRILARARDLAPLGRHKIVLTPSGEAALQWQDGLTTLEGQGYLALDEDHAGIDELFEAAALAEAAGELDEAARLYDTCARADRNDAIAPYNYANIRLAQGAHNQAALAYQRALARDASFIEARYNLAQALEAVGKTDEAGVELSRVLDADPTYSDAVFNLAQLRMKAGEMGAAKLLYERYLALDPPEDWATTARKAILYCTARLSA
ncbi:MAG TPA: tetratricopeptide repeat protein [Caulobacteraceae bacterium]|nr:tetratricopeptide repeat protein [Caulobacteraceae bacterium]